jgi:hypothetical protein
MSEALIPDSPAVVLEAKSFWKNLDYKIGIAFFVVVAGGGIFVPLCIMIYSWFL